VGAGSLLAHLNPEREGRLRFRLFECVKWLQDMDRRLEARALEAT
jgi:hypothetical protein